MKLWMEGEERRIMGNHGTHTAANHANGANGFSGCQQINIISPGSCCVDPWRCTDTDDSGLIGPV